MPQSQKSPVSFAAKCSVQEDRSRLLLTSSPVNLRSYQYECKNLRNKEERTLEYRK